MDKLYDPEHLSGHKKAIVGFVEEGNCPFAGRWGLEERQCRCVRSESMLWFPHKMMRTKLAMVREGLE